MFRVSIQVLFILLSGFIVACSSGGGSGGGGGGATVNGTVVFGQNNVMLVAVVDDQVAPVAELRGTVSGVNQPVFVYVEVTNNGIQGASFVQDTQNSGVVMISAKYPASLGEGVFDDTVEVSVCLDTDCSLHLSGSPKTFNVQYRVTDDIRLGNDTTLISYAALEQPSVFDSSITLKGVDGHWTAVSDQPWLTADISSGVGAQQVNAITAAGDLAPGTHDGTITFTDSTTSQTAAFSVKLVVAAPYIVLENEESATLVADGASSTIYRTTLFDAVHEPFTISASKPSWLDAQITALDSTRHEITLSLNGNPLPAAGVHNETLQFYVQVGGEKIGPTLPLKLVVAPPVLTLSSRGVALMHTGFASKLSETVLVEFNNAPTENWMATVEYLGAAKDWLTVAPEPSRPNEMVINADPSGVSNGEIAEAVVHVQTASGTHSESLRVGLYVDANTSGQTVTVTLPDPNAAVRMRADPIRPLVYISNNSATIDSYNVYTGELVNSYTLPDALIKHITIANDGGVLYAMNENHLQIDRIDLVTGNALAPLGAMGWQTCGDCGNPFARLMIEYVRAYGRDLLVTKVPHILDADTGTLLNPSEIGDGSIALSDGHVVTSANGRKILTTDYYETDNGKLHSLVYNAETQSFHTSILRYWAANTSRARQFSLNSDGSRIYNMCSYPNELSIFDTATMALVAPVLGDFNGVAQLINDSEVLCVSYYQDLINSYPHAWRVNVDSGELLGEYVVEGEIQYNQHTVSSDGVRLITRSNSYQTLIFQSL